MPYVKRNLAGEVAAAFAERQSDATEFVAEDADDLRPLVGDRTAGLDPRRTLTDSDLDLIRVIEDLVAVLLHKNIIQPTDLPQHARVKLLQRRRLRGEMDRLAGLVVEDETI